MDIPSLFMIPSAVSSGKVHSVFPNSTDADFDFNRDSDATRVNSEGLIERVGYYGSELVTNGGFDTDSNWTKGTGWTIANGKATQSGGTGQLSQSISISTGVVCKFTFTVTIQSGTLRISAGVSAPVQDFTESGTHTFNLAFAGNTVLYFLGTSSSFSGSIDSISIKEITGDRARLNYEIEGGLVNTKPSLLLEPQSTNLITYSNDFANSYWTKSGTSISSNAFVSPDGTLNAYKLVEDTSNGSHICFNQQTGASKTFSFFAKSSGNQYVAISYDGGANFTFFDILNGQLGTVADSSRTSKIENYGNGWFRCSMYNGHGTYGATIWMSKDGATVSYQGDGSSGVYIYGAQLEQLSYPTSYIPTNGNTQTRAAETCNGAGTSSILPSEGILYAEFADLYDGDNPTFLRYFTLSDGTLSNVIRITKPSSDTNKIGYAIRIGGTAVTSQYKSVANIKDFNKVALYYKSGNTKFYLNGIKESVVTTTYTMFQPTTLSFGAFNGSNLLHSKCRDIRVYNTKEMTDSEVDILLTKITS